MEPMNNLETAVAKAVASYIYEHCYRTGVVDGSRVTYYPERFVHVETNGDSVLLAFPDESSRDCLGGLNYARDWLNVELLVEGVHFDMRHPWPQDELGVSDYRLVHNIDTKEGLRAFFQEVRGGKTHPLFSTNGLRVQRSFTSNVYSTDRMATWCTHGRPVATLNKWLKRFGVPTLDTTQGNELLAAIDEVLQERKAQCAWAEGSIGHFYNKHSSPPYYSCMAGGDERWFGLYDLMQTDGKLRLLEITRDGAHIGRALVWLGSNPDDLYLDRVYAPPYHDSFEPDAIKALKEFCAAEGIQKTVYQQTAERIGLLYVGGFSIATGCDPSDLDYYPYVDSLRYFGHDGRLRMQNSHSCIVMDQTNGGPSREEDRDFVTLENGDRVPEEIACYSEITGGHYYEDEVTWSDRHGSWIPDGILVELHDGSYTHTEDIELCELYDGAYALNDDCVLLHDGEYALNDDCVLLHDGEYALNDDCVLLHDGEYALNDDCVLLHDGEYALNDDCVLLHDGEYALNDDCVLLHDGEYALNDDACTLPDGRVVLLDDCTKLEDGTRVLTSEQNH